MRNKKTIWTGFGVLAALILGFLGYGVAFGTITHDSPNITPETYRTYSFFASTTITDFNTLVATTTSATSTNIAPFTDTNTGNIDNGYFVIKGAKDVNLFFGRGEQLLNGNTGTSTFNIQVSPDGTNWFDYNNLQPVSTSSVFASSNQLDTRVGTSTIRASTSTDIFRMDLLGWYAIRCIVVETTDGTHSCKAAATW